jgi:hypothetical protein
MNGLERRVVALETRSIDPITFLVLFGDEPVPDGCDEWKIVHIPWLTVAEAKARGWR